MGERTEPYGLSLRNCSAALALQLLHLETVEKGFVSFLPLYPTAKEGIQVFCFRSHISSVWGVKACPQICVDSNRELSKLESSPDVTYYCMLHGFISLTFPLNPSNIFPQTNLFRICFRSKPMSTRAASN